MQQFISQLMTYHGYNDGTNYANCIVGMRPELIPLDVHLNQDLYKPVEIHVNLTAHLPIDHKYKYSKQTP